MPHAQLATFFSFSFHVCVCVRVSRILIQQKAIPLNLYTNRNCNSYSNCYGECKCDFNGAVNEIQLRENGNCQLKFSLNKTHTHTHTQIFGDLIWPVCASKTATIIRNFLWTEKN